MYYINFDRLTGQLFRLYFARQFNDFRGKSLKRGLDKICRNREADLEALLVGSPGLADANVIDRLGVVLSVMAILQQWRVALRCN